MNGCCSGAAPFRRPFRAPSSSPRPPSEPARVPWEGAPRSPCCSCWNTRDVPRRDRSQREVRRAPELLELETEKSARAPGSTRPVAARRALRADLSPSSAARASRSTWRAPSSISSRRSQLDAQPQAVVRHAGQRVESSSTGSSCQLGRGCHSAASGSASSASTSATGRRARNAERSSTNWTAHTPRPRAGTLAARPVAGEWPPER